MLVLIRQSNDAVPAIHNEITFQLKEKNDNIIQSFGFWSSSKESVFVIGTTQSLSAVVTALIEVVVM
jgi:hypothetical protein